MTQTSRTLVQLLVEPARAMSLNAAQWTSVIAAARAESLLGTLAMRASGLDVPDAVMAVFADARQMYELGRRQALWEAECAVKALSGYGGKVVLLKGTAYLAAGMQAGQGRSVGDLDILVTETDLDTVEADLLAAGWEWVKPDPYDDDYYRRWMHELPPLIHRARDRMIDVHHTILPRTARPTPDAGAMLDSAQPLQNGLFVLSPEDMVCHCAAHLIADGDMAGGLRNLWDFHCLIAEFSDKEESFFQSLNERARMHGLRQTIARTLRLAHRTYGTCVDPFFADRRRVTDRAFEARLHCRNGWGQEERALLRLGFYIRSHVLRMPLPKLLRHLWAKWRKNGVPG